MFPIVFKMSIRNSQSLKDVRLVERLLDNNTSKDNNFYLTVHFNVTIKFEMCNIRLSIKTGHCSGT